jgi:fatty acid desaturase
MTINKGVNGVTSEKRNYLLSGPEGERARAKGLVEAVWYKCDIPRQTYKQLLVRRDGPAIRDMLIWFLILGVSGYSIVWTWGTWWILLTLFVYGIVYLVPSGARFHESSHGTVFKTNWLNEVCYQITGFMIMFQPTFYRWSHARHHTDTIIVGRDREIIAERPPKWRQLMAEFVRFSGVIYLFQDVIRHALGRVSIEEKAYIPQSVFPRLFWEARIWLMIYISLLIWCILAKTILPLVFVGVIPSFFGVFLLTVLNITQHGELAEDVLDHRLNTRTFYTNPILRFLYSNMNYHLEHHMFPLVPYYNLPKLHECIKHDCPPAYPSLTSAFIAAMKALWRQRKSPTYHEVRECPALQKI